MWQACSHSLQDVRCLIVIGYSVPATDLTTQALIKSSLSRAKLRLLLVVYPDEEARRRVIKLARSAIGSNTRVLEIGTLRDFGETLEVTPRAAAAPRCGNVATPERDYCHSLGAVDAAAGANLVDFEAATQRRCHAQTETSRQALSKAGRPKMFGAAQRRLCDSDVAPAEHS